MTASIRPTPNTQVLTICPEAPRPQVDAPMVDWWLPRRFPRCYTCSEDPLLRKTGLQAARESHTTRPVASTASGFA